MSVLNALIEIQNFLRANGSHTVAIACDVLCNATAYSSGFDYKVAAGLIADIPTILNIDGTRSDCLRFLIRAIVVHYKPGWLGLVPNGRSFLRSFIEGTNSFQCLDSAQLYSRPPSTHVTQWWDELARHARNNTDEMHLKTGRVGEELTLEYERCRLAEAGRADLRPIWVAAEDNTLGYDVESFLILQGVISPLYIEVKASQTTPPRFFLSRNEWEKSLVLHDRYRLHLWSLPSRQLTLIDSTMLHDHIPADRGHGRWQQFEVCWR